MFYLNIVFSHLKILLLETKSDFDNSNFGMYGLNRNPFVFPASKYFRTRLYKFNVYAITCSGILE